MKKVFAIIAALVVLAVPAIAMAEPATPYFLSDERLAVDTGNTRFAVPATATMAIISHTLGDPVMWRVGTPTGTIGHALVLNGSVTINNVRDLNRIQFTAKTGGSGATLFASFYGL